MNELIRTSYKKKESADELSSDIDLQATRRTHELIVSSSHVIGLFTGSRSSPAADSSVYHGRAGRIRG